MLTNLNGVATLYNTPSAVQHKWTILPGEEVVFAKYSNFFHTLFAPKWGFFSPLL
jgi:hypothetical protein